MSKAAATRKEGRTLLTKEDAQERLERMRKSVRGPFNRSLSFVIQGIMAMVGLIVMKVMNKTSVYGQKTLKHEQPPYLYVSNHLTMIDDFLLDPVLFGPMAVIRMKLRYFPWHVPEEKNFFLNPVMTWFLQKCQAIPITRGRGVFQPGMMRVKELLLDDRIIHIYPEGTRSRNGDIGDGKIGVGKLAHETKMKVLPVYHEGTQSILPVGTNRLHGGNKIAITVGEPIDMSDLYALPESKQVFQQVANRMIVAMRKLRLNLHEEGNNVVEIPEEWLESDLQAFRSET